MFDRFSAKRHLQAVLLCGLWLTLFWPSLCWLATVPFAHANYRLNLLLLCAAVALVAVRLRRSGGLPLLQTPRWSPAAALLLLGAAAAYVAVDYRLRLHTLSAMLLGVGTYGLLGLYLPALHWRRSLGAALLFIAVLPFGAHGSSYLGLGVRVLVAHLVQFLLSGLHIGAVSAQTILVVENGIAHIDVPCSGLRSLWAAGLFYLLATWVLRRAIDLRWLLGGVLLGALVIAANVVRVLLLVLLGLHLGLPRVGEVLHLPLGIIGFCAACGLSLLWLMQQPELPATVAAETPQPAPAALLPALSIALLALIVVHAHRPADLDADRHPAIAFPAALSAQPVPLDEGELSLFGRFGARANKWRFAYRGLSGSILTVSAATERAQHPPELCLVAHGLKIVSVQTVRPQPRAPMRLLLMQAPARRPAAGRLYTAVNWFQARSQTVDNFLARMYLALLGRERRWVLVSVLLDSEVAPDDARLIDFLSTAHAAIARGLEGVQP